MGLLDFSDHTLSPIMLGDSEMLSMTGGQVEVPLFDHPDGTPWTFETNSNKHWSESILGDGGGLLVDFYTGFAGHWLYWDLCVGAVCAC